MASSVDDENGESSAKRRKLEEEKVQAAEVKNESEIQRRRSGKRLKYAMMLSYSGQAYYGMQIQKVTSTPTIENHLLNVLYELRLIDDEEKSKPGKFWFQRAARTDKGVSAIRQVCSMMLPLWRGKTGNDERSEKDDGSGEENCSLANLAEMVNARLPEDIRVMGIRRTTKTFDAKKACESRSYVYTLPSFAFSRIDEDPKDFRITAERLEEANEILSMYEGTHNFYNFTCRRSATDVSCKRYILKCQCDKPFVKDDMEFLAIRLTGQSFMLHQIRKMIGLCIAVVRGLADRKAIKQAFIPTRFDVPIAPSLGLVLDRVHYDYYNKKYEKTHESLEFAEMEDKIQEFREKFIDSVIVETEKNENSMLRWLDTLKNHDFMSTAASNGDKESKASKRSESDNEIDDGCVSD